MMAALIKAALTVALAASAAERTPRERCADDVRARDEQARKLEEVGAFRAGLSLPKDQRAYDKASEALRLRQEALGRLEKRLGACGRLPPIVSHLEGSATWQPSGRAVRRGEEVPERTMLCADAGGRVDVAFGDGNQVKVASKACFTLNPDRKAEGLAYQVLTGETSIRQALQKLRADGGRQAGHRPAITSTRGK